MAPRHPFRKPAFLHLWVIPNGPRREERQERGAKRVGTRARDNDLRCHCERFRKVSNRYPRTVALAYDLDLRAVANASDEQVAAKVAAWERAQGREPRNWHAIGRYERAEDD